VLNQLGRYFKSAKKKDIPVEEISEKVEDIAGVRIICRFVEDIEKIVQLVCERGDFDMRIVDERDYINNTKASGYRSYHLIIDYPVMTLEGFKNLKAEIQIRTMSMDFWATIEHSLRYKYNGNIPEYIQGRLISSAEAAFKLDKEMGNIREEIMQSQRITITRDNAVSEILAGFEKLNSFMDRPALSCLNREFMEILQEEDLDKLTTRLLVLKERVKTLTDVNKVRY
jgi:putative GTP pyrophosphokinase